MVRHLRGSSPPNVEANVQGYIQTRVKAWMHRSGLSPLVSATLLGVFLHGGVAFGVDCGAILHGGESCCGDPNRITKLPCSTDSTGNWATKLIGTSCKLSTDIGIGNYTGVPFTCPANTATDKNKGSSSGDSTSSQNNSDSNANTVNKSNDPASPNSQNPKNSSDPGTKTASSLELNNAGASENKVSVGDGTTTTEIGQPNAASKTAATIATQTEAERAAAEAAAIKSATNASTATDPATVTVVPPASTSGTATSAANSGQKEMPEFQTVEQKINAKGNGTGHYYDDIGADDTCRTSAHIDPKYGCSHYYQQTQGIQMMNMISQGTASVAAGAMGNQVQANAMNSQSQADLMKETAHMNEDTAKTQLAVGGMNMGFGALQVYNAMTLNKNAANMAKAGTAGTVQKAGEKCTDVNCSNAAGGTSLDNGKNSSGRVYAKDGPGSSIGNSIINRWDMNGENSGMNFQAVTATRGTQDYNLQAGQRIKEEQTFQRQTSQRMRSIASNAAGEQKSAASFSAMGGMMSLMTGTQQAMGGAFGLQAAKQEMAVANSLNGAGSPVLTPLAQPTVDGNIAGGQAFVAPDAVDGSGTAQNTAASSADPGPTGLPPSLGTGFDPNALPSGLPGTLPPGQFTTSDPKSSGTGAGGYDAGGSTGAGAAAQEEAQAKLAQNSQGTNYQSSGGAFIGGGGNGKGAEGGPDLSSLLAQFLPKKEEENKPASSIMDFGKQGSGQMQDSYLDRGRNIFKDVEEEYRNQQVHGHI